MRLKIAKAGRTPWIRRAFEALAVLLVAAVPALGLTTLAPETFSGSRATDKEGATPNLSVSSDPLTFDAPTATLRKVRPGEVEENRRAPDKQTEVLPEWKYTQFFFHRHISEGGEGFGFNPFLPLILQELQTIAQELAAINQQLLVIEEILLQILERLPPPQTPFQ